jgi:DNA-binding NarL/FixJ family response regulator
MQESSARPRVLLADDYPEMVRAVRRLLSLDCEIVGTVSDGSELLEAAQRLEPDVIVRDFNLPNIDGLSACRQITDLNPAMKVIMLTAVTDPDVKQAALAAGAAAFVSKLACGDELLSAIKQVCADRE